MPTFDPNYSIIIIKDVPSKGSIRFSLLPSSWMDGSMSAVDPDDVENDTGQFWRTLYKLEKNLSDKPNPLKMASKVR